MAQHHDHHGTMVPQDTNFDNADQPGIAQPYAQAEVEELLYGDDRPASERLARLRELREEAGIRESGDWGGNDPAALLEEIERAIDELSATIANADDIEDYSALQAPLDRDPADRLDALSPDDVDARFAIEGEDDGDEFGPLDDTEWDEGDDFRPERGVH
ncbi:hypothetical protein [Devosia epidermidihirudinis]|nr:hypothetical protein [Devosia epidermidihirudinis]